MLKTGNKVLIKAVAQMPNQSQTYTMSVFKLPSTLCKELNTIMNKFWWGSQRD